MIGEHDYVWDQQTVKLVAPLLFMTSEGPVLIFALDLPSPSKKNKHSPSATPALSCVLKAQ